MRTPGKAQVSSSTRARRRGQREDDEWLDNTPLAGAAFTHLVALAEEAGAVEACDLVLGRDWPDHLHTRPVLLTWDKLGRGHRGGGGTAHETKGQVYMPL